MLVPSAAGAWSLLLKIFVELLPFNFNEREENYFNISFAELVLSDPITQVAEQTEVSTHSFLEQQQHPGTQTSIQHG